MKKEHSAITLAKFLSRYLLLQGEGLTTITHKDVKEQFPNIQRCSMEDAKILYLEGKVVYVYDGKHIVPYIIPEVDVTEEWSYVEISTCKKTIQREESFTDMPTYKLIGYLNTRFNTISDSRKARRELESRDGVTLKKTYKTKRDNEKLKEYEKERI